MSLPIGVSSFGDVVSQVAGLTAETTGFASAAATATAAAAAVTPPGNDADSGQAVVQQGTSTANFIAAISAGLEQTAERAGSTAVVNTTMETMTATVGAAVTAI